MKLDNYPFRGIDWTELETAWNVYRPENFCVPDPENRYGFHPTCYEIDPIKWYLRGVMRQHKGDKVPRTMRKCAKDLRVFLRLLGDPETSNTYAAPMWLGMANIECDWTLIQFTYQLIDAMWD